jgi:hypothetical protein
MRAKGEPRPAAGVEACVEELGDSAGAGEMLATSQVLNLRSRPTGADRSPKISWSAGDAARKIRVVISSWFPYPFPVSLSRHADSVEACDGHHGAAVCTETVNAEDGDGGATPVSGSVTEKAPRASGGRASWLNCAKGRGPCAARGLAPSEAHVSSRRTSNGCNGGALLPSFDSAGEISETVRRRLAPPPLALNRSFLSTTNRMSEPARRCICICTDRSRSPP